MDLTIGFGSSPGVDLVLLTICVFGFILLNSLEKFLSLSLVGFSAFLALLFESGSDLLITLFLFLLTFGFGRKFLLSLHSPQYY